MFTLRPTQVNTIRELYRRISALKTTPGRWVSPRVLVAAHCGYGKTEVSGKIIADLLTRSGRCLFVVDRLELCEQTADRFSRRFGFPSAVCQGRHPQSNPTAPVQVGTWQTLTRRRQWLEAWMEPKEGSSVVIFWDEGHETAWTQFGKEYLLPLTADRSDVIHVMLTATPYRTKPTEGMRDICDDIARGMLPGEAMAHDPPYLVWDRYIQVDMPAVDLSTIRTDKQGDYDEDELGEAMSAGPSIVAAIDALVAETIGRIRLAFAVNIRHAKALCDEALTRGMRSTIVTGETKPAVRKQAFLDLGAGKLELLVNVGIAIKGLDIPEIDAILFSRPTKSRALWFQAIGRGLRLAEGKADCIILDQGDCVERFGRARDLPPYELTAGIPSGQKRDEEEGGEPPTPWTCTHCKFPDNPPSQSACKGCGERRPKMGKRRIDPPTSDGYCCEVGGRLKDMSVKVVHAGERKGNGQWFVARLKHPSDREWYSVCGLAPDGLDVGKGQWVKIQGTVSAHQDHGGNKSARLIKLKIEPDMEYLSP